MYAQRWAMAAVMMTCGLASACVASTPEPAMACLAGERFDGQNCVAHCAPGQELHMGACQPKCAAPAAWNGQACATTTAAVCGPGERRQDDACVPMAPSPQGCTGLATAIDAHTGASLVSLLAPLARQHLVAGSQPVGDPTLGQFEPGECLDVKLQLQAGKCYTIVGAGAGLNDLDIELRPDLPELHLGLPPMPAIAQDQTDGPNAVLGDSRNCWTAILPVPMTVRVRAGGGGRGFAGIQIYAK